MAGHWHLGIDTLSLAIELIGAAAGDGCIGDAGEEGTEDGGDEQAGDCEGEFDVSLDEELLEE